jgi:hypothetical protein
MGLSRAGSNPGTVSPNIWQRRKRPPMARQGGEHGAGKGDDRVTDSMSLRIEMLGSQQESVSDESE